MKILVTGINGLVGKDVGYCLGLDCKNEVWGIGRSKTCYVPNVKYVVMDITKKEILNDFLNTLKPDVIIHCAAMTKLDLCEEDNAQAIRINVEASKQLAEFGCRMIYMSSDAVFNGERGGYKEIDSSDAENFYGKTKYEGEVAVLKYNKNAIALRMSIYGFNVNGNKSVTQWAVDNIKSQNKMKGFTDVVFNPLYTKQIVQIMRILLKGDYVGILNIGSDEVLSKYELFCRIAKKMNMTSGNIIPASVESMVFKAPRTKDTTLNLKRMKDVLGMKFSLEEGLQEFYNDYLRWL